MHQLKNAKNTYSQYFFLNRLKFIFLEINQNPEHFQIIL